MSETEYTDFQSMIDAAKKQGGSSESPSVGKHEGVVKAAKYKPSSTGKLGISLLLQVTEPGENFGRQIWSNQYLSPGPHMHIFFNTFVAMGVPLSWWGQFGGTLAPNTLAAAGIQLATLVKGAPVNFTVKMGEWKGEPQPQVAWINKGKGAALENSAAGVPAPLGAPAADAAGTAASAPLTASPDRPF